MSRRDDPPATNPTVDAERARDAGSAGDARSGGRDADADDRAGGRDDSGAARAGFEAGDADAAADDGGAAHAGGAPPVDLARGGAPLRRVAHFVLLERLGVGGMGVVYRAFDEKLERQVAIKLVATPGASARAHARLLREAQAQARLSHPNVVAVYEVGTLPEGELFIAMELVKGPTLRVWQQDRARSWRDIVGVYAAAGTGLTAAHRVGIVHRDFKPDNVLIDEDGRARVADFGLAFADAGAAAPEARAEAPRNEMCDGARMKDGLQAEPERSPDGPDGARIKDGLQAAAETQPGASPDTPSGAVLSEQAANQGRAASQPPSGVGDAGAATGDAVAAVEELAAHAAAAEHAANQATQPGASLPPDRGPRNLATTKASVADASGAIAAGTASIAGTPGYMAPEQLAGRLADARTDQFAFCLALYEALHGRRATVDPGFMRGERPARRPSSSELAYPGWLWELVMHGLAHEPSERFPSMDALLAELTRKRDRARTRAWTAAALGAVVAAGVVYKVVPSGNAAPLCPLATAELAGIWDDAGQRRVDTALRGTEATYGPSVASSTVAALDRYAGRWLDAQKAACEATNVQHIQSTELLDLRIECLGEQRRSLAAAIDVLQTRPREAVAQADGILGTLGDIGRCSDTEALRVRATSQPAPPPGAAPRIAEVRTQLAHAGAVLAAGDVAGAAAELARATQLAAGLDYAPLRADLAVAAAAVRLAKGDIPGAIAQYDRAVDTAVACRSDELVADIYLRLALEVAERDRRSTETAAWLDRGEAWLRRLGHASDPRQIELAHARGNFQRSSGAVGDAVTTLGRAVGDGEAQWGKDDPRLAFLLLDRGTAYAAAGKVDLALADDQRALAVAIKAWGASNPRTAWIHRALGKLYTEQLDDTTRGEQELVIAAEMFRRMRESPLEAAITEQLLGGVAEHRGDYAGALRHVEQAVQLVAGLPADHPRVAEALQNLGELRVLRKDYKGALDAYQKAYLGVHAVAGAASKEMGLLLSDTGQALLGLDRFDEAQADFEQAREIMQKVCDHGDPDLSYPLKGIGLGLLQRGRASEARAPLERALALRTGESDDDPRSTAEIQWGLARALQASHQDPARARQLAQGALAVFEKLGGESADQAGEVSRWLRR